MAKGIWTAANAAAELAKLTAPDVLGFYTHLEVTEIFAFPKGEQSPVNIFTILVAEDRLSSTVGEPEYIGDRISLKSLPGWKFGIQRYLRSIADVIKMFDVFEGNGIWECSGLPLRTGNLTPIAPQFVPPDSFKPVPWNAVLKNNFWNGAYVLEWSDGSKAALKPFFEKPVRLQELSEMVGKHVPLRLASLSDRLGNIVVQLPATVLMATFGRLNPTAEFFVDMAWHPKATARPLRATCDLDFDGMVSGYASQEINAPYTVLPVKAGEGIHQGILWDDANQIILAATGPSAFINTIGLNMHVMISEPRVFTVPGDKIQVPRRVTLTSANKSTVGGSENSDAAWTRKRMYADETTRLLTERLFVQYKPKQGEQDAEHQRALGDIRKLIIRYGEDGAWLWDPYLSATDVLETLFYCPHVNADLRALTDGSTPECDGQKTTKADFVARQKNILINLESNFYGLRLEYRAKIGQAGWNFHDRFLVFPRKEEGALAWSLGTSVNSVGKAHHILQRVDDGQRVMDAFAELWDALAQPENSGVAQTMIPFLQNAIALSANDGEMIAPSGLLAALDKEEIPLAALSHPDDSNAFFDAFNGDFPFIQRHAVHDEPLNSGEVEQLSGLIRWLVYSLRQWKNAADRGSHLLGALFITLQSLRAYHDFWQEMPADISANTELMDALANLISRSQFEFSSRGFRAVPIWEGEALERFKQADRDGDWVEIGRSWHLFEDAIFPSFIYIQALVCLAHYGFDRLVKVVDAIDQTMKAMVTADALKPDIRLRLAAASKSPYIEFASVYATTSTVRRPVPPSPVEPTLMVTVLVKVSADNARWAAWMEAYNYWPTRFPSIHAPLGEALALVSEAALQSYVASINLQVISDLNAQERRLITDCLRTFKINAGLEKRRYFWTLAYNKWTDWDFDPRYSEQINKICWSVVDYAVVGYLTECQSSDNCQVALEAITPMLSSVDEIWHTSVSDCITEWNRLLSRYQQFAHAITARESGEDWIATGKEYWPFEKSDARYHCKTFNIT